MIRFENVTKSFRVRGRRKVVIDDLTFALPPGKAVALLGRNGAGKSTLLDLVAGRQRPDSGRILHDGTVSWPVGFGGSFHRELTGAQNIRFIARIYGVDTDELVAFVEDFAEIGPNFHMPVRSYSQGMRARLAFGASMGIRFDTYLVDEVTAVGDEAFKRKSRALFLDRMQDAGALFVSHTMGQVKSFCEEAIFLDNGRLIHFTDVDDAVEYHKAMMK